MNDAKDDLAISPEGTPEAHGATVAREAQILAAKTYAPSLDLVYLGTSKGEPVLVRPDDVCAICTRPDGIHPMIFLVSVPGRPFFVDDASLAEVLDALERNGSGRPEGVPLGWEQARDGQWVAPMGAAAP